MCFSSSAVWVIFIRLAASTALILLFDFFFNVFAGNALSCRARQMARSLVGWISRHLHGCFVLILFKGAHISRGHRQKARLCSFFFFNSLSSCDMIQRLYLFSSSLQYSRRGSLACQTSGGAETHSSVRKR